MQGPEDLLHRLFEAQAARVPEAPAILDADGAMSFRQLEQAANALAHRLVAIGLAGGLVGICLARSRLEIVAALAVLKAGGAYLPLDPAYPSARLDQFVRDSGATCAIVTSDLRDRLPASLEPLVVDPAGAEAASAPPEVAVGPDDPCFLVYTSGSTGRPKGVRSPHRSTAVMIHWLHRDHPFETGERFCHRTTLNFIVSAWEIYGPLLAGQPLFIAPASVDGDAAALVRHLADSAASRVVVVPTLVRAMVAMMESTGERLPALRRWISVGEPFPAELARRWRSVAPDAWLLNLYGSSETHSAACHVLRGDVPDLPSVPIGAELPFRRIHLLDSDARPVAPGEDGEICIAGDGLSTGYIGQPELSAERFAALPDLGEAIAYRTGDRGRRLPDGEILMLGRKDRQVKVRGHRVELLEVEATLGSHPDVRQCAVAAREIGGEVELAAFVVAAPAARRVGLRDFMRERLPEAMVPATFTFLERLPTTPNGKLDAMALPDPERVRMLETPCQPPRTPTEAAVCEVWSEVLAITPIGRDDGFFELGGYSNKAATVILRLRDRLGVEMRLETFFGLQSPAAIAAEIDRLRLSDATAETADGEGFETGVIL